MFKSYKSYEHRTRATALKALTIIAHILVPIFVVFAFREFQFATAAAICLAVMLAVLLSAMTLFYIEIIYFELDQKIADNRLVLQNVIRKLFWVVRKSGDEVDASALILEAEAEAIKEIMQEDINDEMKADLSGKRTKYKLGQKFVIYGYGSLFYFGVLAAIGVYLRHAAWVLPAINP
jgi:hypothetical protein